PPHLAKLLEHRLLIRRGDADARVADRDLYEAVLWRGCDLDPPTLRRELDRVRQEVQDHLPDLPFIGLNLTESVIDIRKKRNGPSPSPLADQGQGVVQCRGEMELREFQFHPSRFD